MKTSDRISQKIERLFWQSGDASLGFVYLQPEPRHECFHSRHCGLGITRLAADHEIVGIVHDVGIELFLMAMLLPRQQEAAEVAVGQQRRDYSALWCSPLPSSRCGCLDSSTRDVFDDRRHQPALHRLQHPAICDPSFQTTHQRSVWNGGEVVAQIRIYYLLSPVLRHMPVDSSDGHFGIHSGTKPILLWQQVCLEDRPHHQYHGHLDNAVADSRDAERSLASVALRYPHTQKGLRSVYSRNQLLPQLFQPPLYSLSFDLLERFAICPRCPCICMAASVGFRENILAADLVPE